MPSPSEDYRLIPLSQGQFAKVDAQDFEWLSQWKWCAQYAPNTKAFYAIRSVTVEKGKRTAVQMHRQIVGLEAGRNIFVDHISGDSLDNRRANLRAVTPQQNNCNSKMPHNNTSGYKGVTFYQNLWVVRISKDRKNHYVGRFTTLEEAHQAYSEAAARLRGELARTA